MVEIPVGGYVALVDDEDAELVRRYKWYAFKPRNSKHLIYAANNEWIGNGRARVVLMHRLILGLEAGDRRQGDHKNGNGLDNRRDNLRLANHQKQAANAKKPQLKHAGPSATAFKGVRKIGNRFYAFIKVNYKRISLGGFPTVEEAAQRYNVAARKYFGEFARLNQVDES